ncbi:MAG: hypothetical protein ACTHMZ_03065, partial [Actinomycetes bacterium]
WFGGSLMGAVGVNRGVTAASNPHDRGGVTNAAWDRWTPVNLVAIATHLVGAAGLTYTDRYREKNQKGVAASSITKAATIGAALAATAYARMLGKKVSSAGHVPTESGTTPSGATPPEVAKAQQQLQALQWAIPALTGAVIIETAVQGEQQRPSQVLSGIAIRGAKKMVGASA